MTSSRSRICSASMVITSIGPCGIRSPISSPQTVRSSWDLRGVYVGKRRVRAFLDLLGHDGLTEGWLNDHLQLQVIVDVAPDGKTARSRSRELAMTGQYGGPAAWSAGVYENAFVKQNGVWKFKSVHFYPTFITDYDKGWAKDAQPAPTASAALPPDRPPSETYAIYPKAHVPAVSLPQSGHGRAASIPLCRRPGRRAGCGGAAINRPTLERCFCAGRACGAQERAARTRASEGLLRARES